LTVLQVAIERSGQRVSRDRDSGGASEANAVIRRFNDLTLADQQAVLDFLRSL